MSFLNFTIIIFANSLQYKNANISDFILAAPLEINYTNEVLQHCIYSSFTYWHLISHLLISYAVNEERDCKYMGIQVGNNIKTANVVRLWKT